MALRLRASLLVSQTESEELLAEVVAVLNGMSFPCAYTREQMKSALQETESDYQNDCFVSHSSISERYGILRAVVEKCYARHDEL